MTRSEVRSSLHPVTDWTTAPPSAPPALPLKRRALVLSLATLLLILAAAVASYIYRRQAPVRAMVVPINLTVEPAGPSLRLTWDRNATALKGVARVILHIQDGDFRSDRDLSPSEIGSGSFLYSPKGPAVTFRLDSYAAEPNASALVEATSPSFDNATPPPLPALKAPSSSPVHASPLAATPPAADPYPAQPVFPPPVTAQAITPASPVEPAEKGTVTSHPAPLVKPEIRTETAAERPSVNFARSEPDLSVEMSAEPSSSRLGHIVEKIPLVRRLKKSPKTVAALPTYQAKPILKPADRQRLQQPAAVAVKVLIAPTGKVTQAEIADYGEPPNWTLANAALAAARLWTFQPARTEDEPISSEMILHFRVKN